MPEPSGAGAGDAAGAGLGAGSLMGAAPGVRAGGGEWCSSEQAAREQSASRDESASSTGGVERDIDSSSGQNLSETRRPGAASSSIRRAPCNLVTAATSES